MPTTQRALLTKELKRLRVNAGMTLEQVSSALDWSMSKTIRIEGGTVGISTTDLKALLAQYKVTDPLVVNNLVELARKARKAGWWDKYKGVVDQQFLAYLGYESDAASIKVWQPLLIPGLLQTADYAKEIVRALSRDNAERVDSIVELRRERQRRIKERADPPKQTYVIDEAVIVRPVGGSPASPSIMRDQLRYLTELSSTLEVSIRIVPFSAGAHPGLRGSFTLLEFDNELDNVLYLESSRRGDLILHDPSNADTIADYHETFDYLYRMALKADESDERLLRAITDLDKPRESP
jgi:transcriptional regulator with XRE-family HTH domain